MLGNGDLLSGLAIPRPRAFHSFHSFHALFFTLPSNLTVSAFLGTICTGPSICHGQGAGSCIIEDEIVIIKFLPPVDLLPVPLWHLESPSCHINSAITFYKTGTFITKSLLPSAQNMKAICCLWESVWKQPSGDGAEELTGDGDVRECGGFEHGWPVWCSPKR